MYRVLKQDLAEQSALLKQTMDAANAFLKGKKEHFVAPVFHAPTQISLPQDGKGAAQVFAHFRSIYEPYLQNSTGPQFFGYVIGGNTPAALMGDWLCSVYDQNAFGLPDTVDRAIELETVRFLKELLFLPTDYEGVFCSGATMANYTALAIAREWAAAKQGKSADEGIYSTTPPLVITGTAHASIYKALSMLGIGRKNMITLPLLPNSEAVDPAAISAFLDAHPTENVIVVANAGTVNSGAVDDIAAIAALKEHHDFFLHVEGAIGAVAAASPKYRPLFKGIEFADSFTVDAHKWLNTPYDGAVVLVRGEENLIHQLHVFAQMDSANGASLKDTAFYNLVPEGSRRFRALPAWFTLLAYGRTGYAELVEENCACARQMATLLKESPHLRVLNEVTLNIVAFTLKGSADAQSINAFITTLRSNGVTFLNAGSFLGQPVVRVCISNYLTEPHHIATVAQNIIKTAAEYLASK